VGKLYQKQVYFGVKWEKCVENMHERGCLWRKSTSPFLNPSKILLFPSSNLAGGGLNY